MSETTAGITVSGKAVPGHPLRQPAEGDERTAVSRGLRELAMWLEENPDAPVSRHAYQFAFIPPSVEEVRRIAESLGLPVDAGPYQETAEVRFSGGVTYAVWAGKAAAL